MHPLVGRGDLTHALARAHVSRALPSCILLHGSPGVGKQRIAIWIGQLLLCSEPTPEGPCGRCKSCAMCNRLAHPDLHWYFPLPRPKKASSPEKLKEELEVLRHEALAEIRDDPLRPSVASDDPIGLYLAVAQTIRSRAFRRPSMGDRQIFVIGEAESLVPQEASQEAANALLKLLEEPPAGTSIVLTSNQPERLLATIRSRTLPIHVGRQPDTVVRSFLVEHASVDEAGADDAARLAGGSIGRALAFLPTGQEPGPSESLRQDAYRLLSAVTSTSAGAAYERGLGARPSKARSLLPLLESVEVALKDLAAVAAGADGETVGKDTVDYLDKVVRKHSIQAPRVAAALRIVDEAKEMAAGNVNPQLILSGLTLDLRDALLGPAPAPGRSA